MGIQTRIYQLEEDIAINIPTKVLPKAKLQLVEERVEVPGFLSQTGLVPLLTGRRAKDGRMPIHIPYEIMEGFDIDPNKEVEIRLYRYPGIWLRSHVHHRFPHRTVKDRRVWIPNRVVDILKIENYEYYPAVIKATTRPTWTIRLVEREVREVVVQHMNRTYNTENYAPNKWRWRIPKEIDCHPVLITALNMNIFPRAECHLSPLQDIIFVDFNFTKASARVISERMGYAFRNMAVRNYTATMETDYPFLCEIRATYITSCPKAFYQPDEIHHTPIKQALEITVYNMLKHFFPKLKDEYEYSLMSWADHKDAIDYVTSKVNLRRRHPQIPIDADWKKRYMEYESESEGIQEEFSLEEKRFYQCIKYVRILNESSYKDQDLDRWVYTDADINEIILGRQQTRRAKGLSPEVELDINGFLWEV